MKTAALGNIHPGISVAANAMYPGYVIRGREANLMIDAGINLFGPLYYKSLGEILGTPDRLDYLFLTHSHYDHLGAVPYLKRRIPGLTVGGDPYIGELMSKDSVLERMSRLSEIQRPVFRDIVGDEDVSLSPFVPDRALSDGDSFDLGGISCRVLSVPGHTRDCLAFYVPEIGALFPGEAAGVPQGTQGLEVQVEFLSSYEDYLAGIRRMMDLGPRLIGIGHGFVFTDEDAARFLNESLAATSRYREFLEESIDAAGGDLERAVAEITRKEYDEKGTIFQERNAYIMNLTAQVKHIAGIGRTG